MDSDLPIPTEMDAVELEILRPPAAPLGPFQSYVDPVQRFYVELPVTLGLHGAADQEVEVVARALRRTRPMVEQRARLGYRMGEVVVLCIRLDASCGDVTCPEDATCRDGACEPVAVDSAALALYDPATTITCPTPSR